MDSTIITALISAGAAILGAVLVAVPNYMANKSRDAVESYRLEQLEKSIDKLSKKLDKHDELHEEITKLDTRVSTCERDIKILRQYHIPQN